MLELEHLLLQGLLLLAQLLQELHLLLNIGRECLLLLLLLRRGTPETSGAHARACHVRRVGHIVQERLGRSAHLSRMAKKQRSVWVNQSAKPRRPHTTLLQVKVIMDKLASERKERSITIR